MSFLEFCDEMEALELEHVDTSEDDAYELREQDILDGDAPNSCPESCGGVMVYQERDWYDSGTGEYCSGARYTCTRCGYYEEAE